MISPKALLFLALQQRIQSLIIEGKTIFPFVDRDFGQLDNGSRPPVNWPAVVIRIVEGNYGNLAQNGQKGVLSVSIRIAFKPLSSASNITPAIYRNKALEYYELEQRMYALLHGWKPGTVDITTTPLVTADISGIFGATMRVMDMEEDREDFIVVIKQAYKISFDDWSAAQEITLTGATPNITDEWITDEEEEE